MEVSYFLPNLSAFTSETEFLVNGNVYLNKNYFIFDSKWLGINKTNKIWKKNAKLNISESESDCFKPFNYIKNCIIIPECIIAISVRFDDVTGHI